MVHNVRSATARKVRKSDALRLQELRDRICYPQHLPISGRQDDIVKAIIENQVVIITGETGSGKTTQIPKMCLAAGRGKHGMIGCTQPRRVAAIATASRIAEELGETLGFSVGYKIRFDRTTGPRPLIKIMTDGILLMEAQSDPSLSAYDTIILDEAHERSLNIDFILGILLTLIKKRKNLKVIITSATIDSEKFSLAFHGAPIIDVSGSAYPVDVLYWPVEKAGNDQADLSDPEAAAWAVDRLHGGGYSGDILIFMATERDVRETCEILQGKVGRATEILPLFARLPWPEQRRVFQTGTGSRIIVATNIAETSLTIPGVRCVIDAGTARLSQYNPRLRTNSLPIRAISRSSAEQRKGRCGRVAQGLCIRLYEEDEFNQRPLFTLPEIMRSNLAGVILRMLTLQLGDIATFPFIDRPAPKSIHDGLETLQELGAIVKGTHGLWELTDRGRLMARIPLDPRLARMIIEAAQEGCLEPMVIITAALSLTDPRERPAGKEEEADRRQALFRDRASDFMTLLNIWRGFQNIQASRSSRNRVKKYCQEHFLSYKRMCEWQDVYEQIQQILREQNLHGSENLSVDDYQNFYAAIHKSVLSGYLCNIAYKKEKNIYQSAKGRELILFPGSSLFNKAGNWIVAAEILETSRVFARICANIDSSWLEALGGALCRFAYSEAHWEKNRGEVVASLQITLFGLVIVPRRTISYGHLAPDEACAIFIREALVTGEVKHALPFLEHNLKIAAQIATLEDKIRKADLLVPDEVIACLYEQHLKGVYNIGALKKLIKDRGSDAFLRFTESDLLANRPDLAEIALYPENLKSGKADFPLVYSFSPGNNQDGVTAKIPLHQISLLAAERTEWLIPGLLQEKIYYLLKGLPREYRKKLLPLNNACKVVFHDLQKQEGTFLSSLAKSISRHFLVEIPVTAWPLESLPEHLRMRFAVMDGNNKEVSTGRDLAALLNDIKIENNSPAFEEARIKWEQAGITNWDFGVLPESIELTGNNGVSGVAYPALLSHGEMVHIRLFSDSEEACKSHREGLRLLFSLHFREDLKHLKKNISLGEDLKPWTKYLGGPKTLEALVYKRTTNELFDLKVRSPEAFQTQAANIRPRIQAAGQETRQTILPVIKAYHETVTRLKSLEHDNLANRPACNFLARQYEVIARLAPENFMVDYSREKLLQLPRYFRALLIGSERGLAHLQKAMARGEEMRLLECELQETLKMLPSFTSEEKRQAMDDYFWMLEEYRVSLFAQEIKTPYPVSRKKLAAKLHEIKILV